MLADALWSLVRGRHKGDYVFKRSAGEYASLGSRRSFHDRPYAVRHESREDRSPSLTLRLSPRSIDGARHDLT